MDFFKNSKILYTIVALVIALIAVFTNNSPISLIQQHENSSSTSSSTSDTTSSNQCSAETQSDRLFTGKELVLQEGNDKYGYCHIVAHMQKPGTDNYHGKSQFSKYLNEKQAMTVAEEVINEGEDGTNNKSGNYVKEKYISSLNQEVRVVYTDYRGKDYDYSVTTMYPIGH
ncbi:LPS export ABC transporter periplasmic protein LptC [Priestia megaterium]|uniref:LPS export ABC transporter periplasmic protein LptC n=1 Tax=Priestia megaterium TaxID=1404 RepID=UPI0004728C36|nr:LPS export ABC transporter periplasmic protein LptC [Priestia megaterium]MED3913025.1 LPS export ABC transporter periplasmic protein LptC [Priestia megaterium]PFB05720.1 hypothetical protein CN383_05300 [Priestia megaterium]PFR97846.1 hypothetical protein COK39_03150 [Priestia megaterium]TCN12226.1 hypothetical protein EV581_103599 [Bacillus sp. BK006]